MSFSPARNTRRLHVVMAGLVPATHAFARHEKPWMSVTGTGMTSEEPAWQPNATTLRLRE
jgi:hypothetical protein